MKQLVCVIALALLLSSCAARQAEPPAQGEGESISQAAGESSQDSEAEQEEQESLSASASSSLPGDIDGVLEEYGQVVNGAAAMAQVGALLDEQTREQLLREYSSAAQKLLEEWEQSSLDTERIAGLLEGQEALTPELEQELMDAVLQQSQADRAQLEAELDTVRGAIESAWSEERQLTEQEVADLQEHVNTILGLLTADR